MKHILILILSATLTSGCASIDYKTDESKPQSNLKVSTNYLDGKNIHVRHHGSIKCEDPDGKLMAMLNSITLGIEGGSDVNVRLVAQQQATISLLTVLPFDVNAFDAIFKAGRDKMAKDYIGSVRRYYLTFTPQAAHDYQIDLHVVDKSASIKLYELLANGKREEIRPDRFSDSCK